MTTQPEALRLADALDEYAAQFDAKSEAAAELRHLHKVNQELQSILIDFKKAADSLDSSFDADAWMNRVNEAIEKFQP